jgi:hypothetical protein
MAKKKPGKGRKVKIDKVDEKCLNSEQAEAALVYAVKSFNGYFEQGMIVVNVKGDRYKIVTFGPGDPKEHFYPVMWQSIKAAFEGFKAGPSEADTYES